MKTKLFFSSCLALGLVFEAGAQPVTYGYDPSGNLAQRSASPPTAPVIVGQPQGQIVEPGGFGSFSVLLADSRGCTYQWQFYGTNLPGRTADSLLLLNVSPNNLGPYSVVVTNSEGSVTSTVAQLYLDSNRNGMPDLLELAWFGNLNQNAAGDFDVDGISNLQEFYDGTSPTNKNSFRTRLTVFADGGVVTVAPEQVSYDPTNNVNLTASPLASNAFYGWSGDLSARTNPASLLMNTNKTVRACFLCQPAVAGLAGWWRGESDATDFIGGHNGAFYSGTNVLAPSITLAGMVGGAFVFYGTNEIQVPDADDLRPAQLTLEGWVFPTVQGNYQTVIAKGSAVNDDDAYYLGILNGVPYFWTRNGAGMNPLSGGVAPLNQWTHLAATFDGSTKRLYVNGLLVGTQGGLAALSYDPQNIPLTIGSDWTGNSASYLFNGLVDEVSLFNRPLAPAEVMGLYLASVGGKCTNRPVFTSSAQLAEGTQGLGYTQQVTAVLGALPVTLSLSAGSLPAGLALSADGWITGIPGAAGSNVFAITATDATGLSAELICGLHVGTPGIVSGLVSWWRAENNTLDFFGTRHGALSNGATYATGKVGQAFSFDGANDYFTAPDAGLPSGNAPRTVEFWMRYEPGASGNHPPFTYGGQSAPSSFYVIVVGNRLYIGNYGGGDTPGSTIATDGNWHHIALTHDSSTARMYVDAQLDALVNRTYSTVLAGGFYMGWIGGSDYFRGQVDELTIYDRALTQTEIATIYNAGGSGKQNIGPFINAPPQLPDAVAGQTYSNTFTAVFGTPPFSYMVTAGALPSGLTLSAGGVLSGTPNNAGRFDFRVRVTDASASTNDQQFTLQVFAAMPPPPGLVSWWRAENDALDASGTNHGVLRNGAGFGPGKVGQAFALNGSSQSIDVADAPVLRPASVTLEAWVLLSSAGGLQHVFAKPLGTGTLDSYGIWINGATLTAGVSDTNGFGPFLTASFASAIGAWHHIAYTFEDISKLQALYLDGAQVAAGISTKSIGYDNQPLLLGRDIENGSPSFFLSGRIDEAAIYNRALGSNEVASLYLAGAAGKTGTGPYFTTPPMLPKGIVSQSYSQTLAVARATNPVGFTLIGGGLPPGTTLSSAGALTGNPSLAGNFSFVVRATDAASLTATQSFSLQVLPRVTPPAGIAGWWRAENDAVDVIGGNNGLLINNAAFAGGKVGQAFSLNGISDAIEIEDAPALRPASLTFEAWVMFLSGGTQVIMAKALGNGSLDSYVFWLENGNLNGAVADILGNNVTVSVPFAPVSGQWYHLAFTFDDSTKQEILYVNSTPAAFGIANLSIGYDTHPLLLGADVNYGTMNILLQGRIDEATFYNRALSAAEIAAIFSADLAGKATDGPYFTTPPALPDAAYGHAYTQNLSSVHGTAPVSYALTNGSLPAGLTFNGQGRLSGVPTNLVGIVPTNATLFNFTVRVTDAAGLWAEAPFSLRVAAPVTPVPGLISWWRAENNALDTISTNHGVAVNGTSYAAGEVGLGFALDGINDYVQIPDAPALRPASLTIECWVMFMANTGARTIFAKPLGTGTLDSFALWLENGNLRAIVCDTSSGGPVLSAPFTPVLQQWYHLAYTFDGFTHQQVLYLNNQTVAFGTGDRSIAYDANPVLLGCDIDNGNRAWFVQGRIDEAAIYNRALNASEIAAIYYAGPAGRTTSGPYFTTGPTLPDVIVSQSYNQSVTAVRGAPPVSYALIAGALPPGFSFSPGGLLSGVPSGTGVFNFTVRATDSSLLFCEQAFRLQIYAPILAPVGLVDWWRGESNAVDELGAHNGTPQGNPAYGPGRVGTAFNLDGINSYIDLGPWNAGSNWTLEAWVNPSARPAGRRTIVGDLANCMDWSLEMIDGQLGGLVRRPGGCVVFIGSGVYPTPGFWYHIATTCDGTNASVYLNGVFSGTAAVEPNYIGPSADVRIGSSVCCGEYFPGLLDEVSLYNRALTAGEIASIYNAGPAGKQLVPPILLRVSAQANTLTISFGAAVGRTYTLESKPALDSGSWSPVATMTATTTTIATNLPITAAQRFYRARTGN